MRINIQMVDYLPEHRFLEWNFSQVNCYYTPVYTDT